MTTAHSFTATARANIAFIKYWGNRPEAGNLPLNPSISMTLDSCVTRTTAAPLPGAHADHILIGGSEPHDRSRIRLVRFLDSVRSLAGRRDHLSVASENSFPAGCGIASSASGFAALAGAAAAAFGLKLDSRALSRLARHGSGSAARSVFGGYVELHPGEDAPAFAELLAPESAWPDLRDIVLIVSDQEKPTSSADGHKIAHTSEMLAGRLAAVPERAERVRQAIRARDIERLGDAAEEDALSMHAVMMTSRPPLVYWSARTLDAIRAVYDLRRNGLAAWFTIDAGPNLHVLTRAGDLPAVQQALRDALGVPMIVAGPGPGLSVTEGEAL